MEIGRWKIFICREIEREREARAKYGRRERACVRGGLNNNGSYLRRGRDSVDIVENLQGTRRKLRRVHDSGWNARV